VKERRTFVSAKKGKREERTNENGSVLFQKLVCDVYDDKLKPGRMYLTKKGRD